MLTMIEPTSNTTLLDIQTRTAQAINANGTLINATVFQAFAVQEKNGGQAMVEINLAKTGRVYPVIGTDGKSTGFSKIL